MVEFLNSFFSHFSINKPLTFAIVDILHCPVVVNIEYLICVCSDTKIKPANVQRPATRGDSGVGGSHIARHFSSASEITPGGEHFKDAVRLIFPNKTIWALGTLFPRRRCIEDRFDGMVIKVNRLVMVRQKI